MNEEIYVFTTKSLPPKTKEILTDLVLFRNDKGYWGIGKDPNCFWKWVNLYAGKNSTVEKILQGPGKKFMAQVIYFRYNSDNVWRCVKNRFGSFNAEPPFTSLEEAKLKSSINGWADPVLIAKNSDSDDSAW